MANTIHLFRGTNRSEILRTIHSWKEQFYSKHGDFNVLEIHKGVITQDILSDCQTTGFLGGSRLIIIYDVLTEKARNSTKNIDEVTEETQLVLNTPEGTPDDTDWIGVLTKIPPTNFILYIGNPKPASMLEKWLEKNATLHEYNAPEGQDLVNYISQTLRIDTYQAQKIAIKLNYNYDLATQETKKLLLACQPKWSEEELEAIIPDYSEENIFKITDLFLNKNPKLMNETWNMIQKQPDYERSVAALTTIIRKLLIALYFPAYQGLPITPYQRNTAKRLTAQKHSLTRLFDNLVEIDIKSKSSGIPERKESILFALLEYCYS